MDWWRLTVEDVEWMEWLGGDVGAVHSMCRGADVVSGGGELEMWLTCLS